MRNGFLFDIEISKHPLLPIYVSKYYIRVRLWIIFRNSRTQEHTRSLRAVWLLGFELCVYFYLNALETFTNMSRLADSIWSRPQVMIREPFESTTSSPPSTQLGTVTLEVMTLTGDTSLSVQKVTRSITYGRPLLHNTSRRGTPKGTHQRQARKRTSPGSREKQRERRSHQKCGLHLHAQYEN